MKSISSSVFVKLFISVMLALVLFAVAMIFLTKVVHNNNNSTRSEFLAGQIVEQINPFLHDLNEAPNRLQSRFMLAVIKKSFDIFDESYDAKSNCLRHVHGLPKPFLLLPACHQLPVLECLALLAIRCFLNPDNRPNIMSSPLCLTCLLVLCYCW